MLTAFFGDAEYQFNLTSAMIRELETKAASGIGAIAQRVFTRNFSATEINETIRCALIGAGTAPKKAAELIAAYAESRPIFETYEVAAKILERALFGNPNETKDNGYAS